MWSTARTNPLPERPSGTAHYGRTNADGGDGINTPAAGAAGIARANTLTTACLKYDRRGSQLDLAARNVATGPASPNRECHISETQMLAHIKPGEEITYTHLIANGDPLIAGAFAIRQVWFVGVVDGLTGAVSWVALFSPSALEMYFAMRVAYLIDAITGFDHGGYDAQGWDYALNPMYVVERRDVCVLYWVLCIVYAVSCAVYGAVCGVTLSLKVLTHPTHVILFLSPLLSSPLLSSLHFFLSSRLLSFVLFPPQVRQRVI